MGWFGNKQHKESSKSTSRPESSSSRGARREYSTPAAPATTPSPGLSVYANTAPTVKATEQSIHQEYEQFSQPAYSEDVEEQTQNEKSMGGDHHRGVHDDRRAGSEDDEMVMIDKGQAHGEEYEDASRSFSQAEDTLPERASYNDTSKQNHLNSLFNGHLMKWKFEAEEGSGFIRIPAFMGALGLIGTSIAAVVMYPEAWEAHSIVMTVCVVIMSIFIAVLEGRFLSLDPLSARAHLRNIMTRNFNILRFLWGRGLLYMCAGVLNVAQTWLITIISGSAMIALGIIAFIVGVRASRKFAALRNSLSDESFLLLVFSNYDGDGDGYLSPYEFALLLSSLGMELDDRYTLKAFTAIDADKNRKISFEELHHWWTSGYIERGRRQAGDAVDEESYRRMD